MAMKIIGGIFAKLPLASESNRQSHVASAFAQNAQNLHRLLGTKLQYLKSLVFFLLLRQFLTSFSSCTRFLPLKESSFCCTSNAAKITESNIPGTFRRIWNFKSLKKGAKFEENLTRIIMSVPPSALSNVRTSRSSGINDGKWILSSGMIVSSSDAFEVARNENVSAFFSGIKQLQIRFSVSHATSTSSI